MGSAFSASNTSTSPFIAAWAFFGIFSAGTATAIDMEKIDGTEIPVEDTYEFSRVEANEWYAEGWCKHIADLRVRALAALSEWDDYQSLATVIDREVPRAGGDSFVVNAYGWLQEPEERDTLWRPFAEIEVMDCDMDKVEKERRSDGNSELPDATPSVTLDQYLVQLRNQPDRSAMTVVTEASHSESVVTIKRRYRPEFELLLSLPTDASIADFRRNACRTWQFYLRQDPRLAVRTIYSWPDGAPFVMIDVSEQSCSASGG